MSKVVLIAGMCQDVPVWEGYDYIGIDRGALCCVKQQIQMLCAVGDFDSVSEVEKQQIAQVTSILPLPEHKNETDTEVAIHYALQHDYDEIVLYGGLGGRIDHELANVYLLMNRNLPIILMNEQNRMRVLHPGVYHIKKHYTYLSFLALEESCISEEGVAYPLHFRSINNQDIYTISNEIIEEHATITIHEGSVIMIEAND